VSCDEKILALRARQYFIAQYDEDPEHLLLCQVMSRHGTGKISAVVVNGGYSVKFENGVNHSYNRLTRRIIHVYEYGVNVERNRDYEQVLFEFRKQRESHATTTE
jgi:hypothetical protein